MHKQAALLITLDGHGFDGVDTALLEFLNQSDTGQCVLYQYFEQLVRNAGVEDTLHSSQQPMGGWLLRVLQRLAPRDECLNGEIFYT